MLFFLRKIRRELMQSNKITTYLLYAVGEILLVVIGILIAVNIDDWNEARNNRIREVQYLRNIKLDLQKDMTSLETLIATRHDKLRGTEALLSHIKGKPIEDLNQVVYDVSLILGEGKFIPNNTTFNELSNSGNLNLIRNDSIKTLLLELENLFKTNELANDHESFDYREYISKPTIGNVKMDLIGSVSLGGITVEEGSIRSEDFDGLFANLNYRNGLHITKLMSGYFIESYDTIMTKEYQIIKHIDRELEDN